MDYQDGSSWQLWYGPYKLNMFNILAGIILIWYPGIILGLMYLYRQKYDSVNEKTGIIMCLVCIVFGIVLFIKFAVNNIRVKKFRKEYLREMTHGKYYNGRVAAIKCKAVRRRTSIGFVSHYVCHAIIEYQDDNGILQTISSPRYKGYLEACLLNDEVRVYESKDVKGNPIIQFALRQSGDDPIISNVTTDDPVYEDYNQLNVILWSMRHEEKALYCVIPLLLLFGIPFFFADI